MSKFYEQDRKISTVMRPTLSVLALKAGDLIEMYDGTKYTIVDNPQDGIWLHVTDENNEELSVDLSEVKSFISR